MTGKPARSAATTAVAAGRSSGFVWLVRAGFLARGLIYAVIGGLALALALGAGGGAATNQQGALAVISAAPLGGTGVAGLAVALLAYAVWQIGQAILGRGLSAADRGETSERLGNLVSGLAHLGLCVLAVKILVAGPTGGPSGPRRAAAGVLGWPGGQWLVGLAGVVLVAVSLYLGYDGARGGYLDDAKTEQMSPRVRRALDAVGRVGLVSRAVVFALIGYFLLRTAIDFDPNKAIGVDGALRELARQPYGSWLLGIVAAGLLVFAAGSVAETRYRRL